MTSGLKSFSPAGGGASFGPRPTSNVAIGARSKPPPLPTPTHNKGTKHIPAKLPSTKLKPTDTLKKLTRIEAPKGTSSSRV